MSPLNTSLRLAGRRFALGGRFDRYIGRLFALSYGTAFLLVVALYLILDMALNLDRFFAKGDDGSSPATGVVLEYFALRVPFLYLEMSPFVTLIAGLFTAARLSRSNEIVAAVGAGISPRRLFLPLLIAGALLALGMFALREWATGTLGSKKEALEQLLIERYAYPEYTGLWVRSLEGYPVRIETYYPEGPSGAGPEIQGLSCRIQKGDVVRAVEAERAVPDPDRVGAWRLEEGFVFDVGARESKPLPLERLEGVTFTAADLQTFARAKEKPLELSFSGARRLLERRPNDARIRTVYYYQLTLPLAGLVLLSVGMPFLVRQERGRGAERIAAALFLCMAYFGTDLVTRTLGMQGTIGPVHAAWLPIVLFGSLGAVLYTGMRA